MPGTGRDSGRLRFQPWAGPRGKVAIHLALVLGVAFSAGWPAEGLAAAIPIGREKQLLWDDYLIETLHNTGFVLNQAEKAPNNPVIRQDRPWEGNLIRVATVFYDEDQGRFRLWYTSENVKPSPGDRWERSGQIVCYATSRDGYRWTKPNVGRVDFNGSTRNNILDGRSWPGFKGGIIRDAHDPDPSRRYKGLVMSVAGPEPNSTSSPGMRFDLYTRPMASSGSPMPATPSSTGERDGAAGARRH